MRNNNVDILKIILALLVIALHIFPVSKLAGAEGMISYVIASGITRIAVPTFFLITGYFLRNKLEDRDYIWKYCKRILLLYVVWQCIYIPDLFRFYHLGRYTKLQFWLQICYGYWHLWYLLASVLAVYGLFITRKLSLSIKYALVISLYAIGYLWQIGIQSGMVQSHFWITAYNFIGTTRNFLFFAFPMLLLGTLYESWKGMLKKYIIWYLPFGLLLIAEACWYYHHQVKAMDFLVVLPVLSMFTLHWFQERSAISEIKIPATLSLGIYLCHPYAIRLVYEFIPQKTLGITFFKYVIIVFLALLFWKIIEKINKKFPYFF